MSLSFILGLFLYFPEDKSEYIPAFIKLAIMFIIAIFVIRFFIRISKKEEQKAKELEEKIKASGYDENR